MRERIYVLSLCLLMLMGAEGCRHSRARILTPPPEPLKVYGKTQVEPFTNEVTEGDLELLKEFATNIGDRVEMRLGASGLLREKTVQFGWGGADGVAGACHDERNGK